MRDALVRPDLPHVRLHEPVAAATQHVRVRQVLAGPTSAKALTPDDDAPERERRTDPHHLRELLAYVALRAQECVGAASGPDLLVIGQKAAIDLMRIAGPPPRVEAAHFNAHSGLDPRGDVRDLMILGRTLPAPLSVNALAADVAQGLSIRHDDGSQYTANDFQKEIEWLGATSSPAFVRAPEANGCAGRFIRTLKENLLWARTFRTVEELRLALIEFRRSYNETG